MLGVAGDQDAARWRGHARGNRLQTLALFEEGLVTRLVLQERGDDLLRVAAARHQLQQLAIRNRALQIPLQGFAEHLGAVGEADDARFDGAANKIAFELALVLDVGLGAPALGAEERWLGDVDVAAIDQLRHLPVEERQQQRADVRAVDVGVGHDDDAVVAQLVGVEVVDADATTERRDHRLDFVAAEHLVEAGLLDVQDLALDRQNRLKATIAALLGRATG